jgi:hypothetical protein
LAAKSTFGLNAFNLSVCYLDYDQGLQMDLGLSRSLALAVSVAALLPAICDRHRPLDSEFENQNRIDSFLPIPYHRLMEFEEVK